MSQQVDLSTPLTQAEYDYLTQRSQADVIARAHSMHGTTDADYVQNEGDWSGPQSQPVSQSERAAVRREQLLAELAEIDRALGTDDEDEAPGDVDSDEEAIPYEDWTSADLDTELKNRKLATGGTKAEKAKRLYTDDESTGE